MESKAEMIGKGGATSRLGGPCPSSSLPSTPAGSFGLPQFLFGSFHFIPRPCCVLLCEQIITDGKAVVLLVLVVLDCGGLPFPP